jgi:ATP-dependent DNA helicase RecG
LRLQDATWTFAGLANFWARQSGAPLLRFADLATDVELLAWARESAPLMLDRHNALAQRHILRWLGGKADYLKA